VIESVKGKGGEYQRRMRTIRATMPAEFDVLSMDGVVGLFDQYPGLKVPPQGIKRCAAPSCHPCHPSILPRLHKEDSLTLAVC
jgi:hypothetical protein